MNEPRCFHEGTHECAGELVRCGTTYYCGLAMSHAYHRAKWIGTPRAGGRWASRWARSWEGAPIRDGVFHAG